MLVLLSGCAIFWVDRTADMDGRQVGSISRPPTVNPNRLADIILYADENGIVFSVIVGRVQWFVRLFVLSLFLKAMKSPYPDEIKIDNHVPLKVGFDGTEKEVGVEHTDVAGVV